MPAYIWTIVVDYSYPGSLGCANMIERPYYSVWLHDPIILVLSRTVD